MGGGEECVLVGRDFSFFFFGIGLVGYGHAVWEPSNVLLDERSFFFFHHCLLLEIPKQMGGYFAAIAI